MQQGILKMICLQLIFIFISYSISFFLLLRVKEIIKEGLAVLQGPVVTYSIIRTQAKLTAREALLYLENNNEMYSKIELFFRFFYTFPLI